MKYFVNSHYKKSGSLILALKQEKGGNSMCVDLDKTIKEEKEKVIKELSKWICNELKNTSSIETESILPDIIAEFKKLTS